MTLKQIKAALPGTSGYVLLAEGAKSGNPAAMRNFIHACAWAKLIKNPELTPRQRDLSFKAIVQSKLIEVTLG